MSGVGQVHPLEAAHGAAKLPPINHVDHDDKRDTGDKQDLLSEW